MRLTSGMFVAATAIFSLALSLPAQVNAAPQEQGQSASAAYHSPQLWRSNHRIEDLKDVVFDFDTHESSPDQAILEANVQWLKDHPDVRIRLAGYTDPRGDIVYNLVLSQKRADTVKQQLIQLGVAENRIAFATGWGELYPNCLESTEECWKHNRRVEFLRAIE